MRPWMVSVVAPLALYAALDLAAREFMRRQGWFDSWEYTTIADRTLGYRLRPGVSNQFTGVSVHIDAEGRRVAVPGDASSFVKRPGELLVFALGDSNTFGADRPYAESYAARLEKKLAERTGAPVRVVDLGVPGYSLVQGLLALEKQLATLRPDVVVMNVNSANDRVFIGRPDFANAFEGDARARVYELGPFISYPLLFLTTRQAQRKPLVVPDLAAALPVPRVPLARYADVLRRVGASTRRHGARLVLLSSGESSDSDAAEEGLVELRQRHYAEALRAFEAAHLRQPGLFAAAFHAYHCARLTGDAARATAIVGRYRAARVAAADSYIENLAFFSEEYASTVRRMSEELGVPLVDLRAEFRARGVSFSNGHYDTKGHELVAAALSSAVASSSASSQLLPAR